MRDVADEVVPVGLQDLARVTVSLGARRRTRQRSSIRSVPARPEMRAPGLPLPACDLKAIEDASAEGTRKFGTNVRSGVPLVPARIFSA